MLVIGADGGVGSRIVAQLHERGAGRIYGAVLHASAKPGAAPDYLEVVGDLTDPRFVSSLPERCPDVTLLINASGITTNAPLDPLDELLAAARREYEVNCLGQLSTTVTMAPVIERNGGGTVVNMLSITALVANPLYLGYAASKAAAWSVTNGLRLALFERGVRVVAVMLGVTDTPMSAGLRASGPVSDPADIAARILQGIEADLFEILCDERSVDIKNKVSRDIEEIYLPMLQR